MNITRKRKLLETADERPSVSKNAVDLNHCIAESALTHTQHYFLAFVATVLFLSMAPGSTDSIWEA